MPQHVLVTGATGYIGGRLVPELLEQGHKVRCLARTPAKLEDLPWVDNVEVVKGDINDKDSLKDALEGIESAYYLVHSMEQSSSGTFAGRDRKAARAFRQAADEANVKRVIYLGGLGDDDDPHLSPHLSSRHEVGNILADGKTATIELRAAIIIGSGSASFEMLRNLVEVLPVMITPKWVNTRVQPIAIRDVLYYLINSLDIEEKDQVIEIGGPDVLTYKEVMQRYAKHAGMKRRHIVTVPLLTPHLSSHWIGLVTPLPTSLAKPLVNGLMNEVIVKDHRADELMPHKCIDFDTSIDLAIERTRDLEVTTSWADAEIGGRSPADPMPTDPEWSGGTVLNDEQVVTTDASAHDVYKIVTSIGGKRGWFVADRLWEIRGVIDKLVGGVGMRRGRRHPDNLRIGDALDFWRVEALVPDKLLRLRAEMRLPGVAWLEWTIDTDDEGKTKLTQRARYQPRGLSGRAYWYSLKPFHGIIFAGLAHAITSKAEALSTKNGD
jgi:uncharacterized protein YbjT (DUF2867 family)/uncharacterized protein YndB with AHSA1/START domain